MNSHLFRLTTNGICEIITGEVIMRKKQIPLDNVVIWKPGVFDARTGKVKIPDVGQATKPNPPRQVTTARIEIVKRRTHCTGGHFVPAGTEGLRRLILGSNKSTFTCIEHARLENAKE